jgi:hypothetical protein
MKMWRILNHKKGSGLKETVTQSPKAKAQTVAYKLKKKKNIFLNEEEEVDSFFRGAVLIFI